MTRPQIEVLFLGTGVSECVPNIACATAPDGCFACRNALKPGSRDARRQSSILVRIQHEDRDAQHILIDCGATFAAAAVEHMPKHQIRKLDAVLLTHPHADCINGLGELRAWTMNGAIQETMPIYLDEPTHREVAQCFPYFLDTKLSTAAAVAELDFHVFDRTEPLELCGVTVQPFDVEHGRIRSLGFVIDGRVLYLPDYCKIPEASFRLIERVAPSLSTAIIGTVRVQPHPSLGSLPQTVAVAQRLKLSRVLMTKIADGITHETWVSVGAALSKVRPTERKTAQAQPRWTSFADYQPPRADVVKETIKYTALHTLLDIRDDDTDGIVKLALSEVHRHVDAPIRPMTLAPAYDGLLIRVE